MSTKISKVNAERLSKMGISVKTEEEAKKQLLERLEKAGIPGMEDESIDNLIDIVSSFAELDDENVETEDTKSPAEEEADDLAEEAAEEEAEKEVEEAEEAEEEAEAGDQEAEEATAEEEVEAPEKDNKTVKADTKKKAEKAAKKTAEKTKKSDSKKDKKADKKEADKKRKSERGDRLIPQKNPDDLDLLRKTLGELFPEPEFSYVAVSQGISIKYNGANSHPVAIMFENVYAKEGKLATTNVVLNTFRSQAQQDKLAEDGVDFVMTWNSLPWLKNIPWEDAMEIVKAHVDEIKTAVSGTDSRLGKNREKMEADLKQGGKKASAKKEEAAKKAPAKSGKTTATEEAAKPEKAEKTAPKKTAEDKKEQARAALAKAAAAKKGKTAKK